MKMTMMMMIIIIIIIIETTISVATNDCHKSVYFWFISHHIASNCRMNTNDLEVLVPESRRSNMPGVTMKTARDFRMVEVSSEGSN